jgi:acyl-CoA reductase-like NAD-dependent aldehyde dehydrogenase
MIVCSDANLERAANGAAFGGFVNNGQFCCGIERVYVVESVADAFLDKLVAKTEALRVGGEDPFDIGPFIMERQIDIVEQHVQDAVEKGARVLAGGRRHLDAGRLYYEPTVLVDVTHDMDIMREETFGPVLPIMRCRDEAHAIELANDSNYGLSGSVWTRNKSKGQKIARQMETGSVCVNETGLVYGAFEVPFGGVKSSGVGSVHGANALRSYCSAQPVLVDRFGFKKEAVWFPYTKKTLKGLKKALTYIWGWPLRLLIK